MKRWSCAAGLLVALTVVLPALGLAQTVTHPLDPLTRQEHFAMLEVLQQAGKLTPATRFTRLEVKEPEKASGTNSPCGRSTFTTATPRWTRA